MTATRLLIVKEGRDLYGAEKATVKLLRTLDPERIIPTMLIREYQDKASPFLEAVNGLQLETAISTSDRQLMDQIRARAGAFDAILTIGYKCHILGWWALRGNQAKKFAMVHGWVDTDVKLRLYNRVARFCLSSFDGVFTASTTVPVKNDRMVCLSNGVSVAELTALAEAEYETDLSAIPTICFVGRLEEEKGLLDLLEAARSLEQYRLVVVGEGSLREAIEERARGLNVQVSLLGHLANPMPVLQQATLLVLPSHTEATPLVLLEAMALKVPIVATAVGGVPEIIADEVTGLLVSPHSPEELRDRIRRLLADNGLRKRLAEAAYQDVQARFTEEAVATKFMDTLEHWIKT